MQGREETNNEKGGSETLGASKQAAIGSSCSCLLCASALYCSPALFLPKASHLAVQGHAAEVLQRHGE